MTIKTAVVKNKPDADKQTHRVKVAIRAVVEVEVGDCSDLEEAARVGVAFVSEGAINKAKVEVLDSRFAFVGLDVDKGWDFLDG